MIGKQVNFYMLPQDERLFLSFVFKDPKIELIASSNSEPNVRLMDRFAYLEEIQNREVEYLFWNRDFPIDRADIKKVEHKEYNEDAMDFLPTGKTGFRIDKINAPVIEYSPAKLLKNGFINRSRIWAGMYYFKNCVWERKSEDFESWYDRIARWLRRNFSRTPDSSFFYLGPELIKLHKEGKVKYKPYEGFNPELGEVFLKG